MIGAVPPGGDSFSLVAVFLLHAVTGLLTSFPECDADSGDGAEGPDPSCDAPVLRDTPPTLS